jgi:hypothetical protein
MPPQVVSSRSSRKRASRPFASEFRLDALMCEHVPIKVWFSGKFPRTFVADIWPLMRFQVCAALIDKHLASE